LACKFSFYTFKNAPLNRWAFFFALLKRLILPSMLAEALELSNSFNLSHPAPNSKILLAILSTNYSQA